MCGPAGETFRYRGRTPPPEVVADDLWRGVAVQFVVEDRRDGAASGLVGLCNASFESCRSQAFAIAQPGREPVVSEGFGVLCEWAFEHFGLHRIHLELPEFNAGLMASLGDAAVLEGRLRNYELWRGRWWDLLIVVLTPTSFDDRVGELLRARRAPLPTDVRVPRDELVPPTTVLRLVEELWPPDSLGVVELLDALEHESGAPLGAEVLQGLLEDGGSERPADVAEALWRRAISSRAAPGARAPSRSTAPW